MTDTPIRKTLSLKRKKCTTSKLKTSQEENNQQALQQNNHANRGFQKPKRNYQEHDVSFSTLKDNKSQVIDHVMLLAKSDTTLADLQQKREELLKQIHVLEQRLIFISSEPLQAACHELKKQDTEILCQINNHLIK